MFYRKWIVHTLLGLILAVLGGAGYLYWQWTDPQVVRDTVLAELRRRLPGADISLGSAQVRLTGGVTLTDLTVRRADEAHGRPIAQFPRVILCHDKSELNRGKIALRKIELHQPVLSVVRRADGSWNFAGLTGPAARGEAERLPIVEFYGATLSFVDQGSGRSPLVVHDLSGRAEPDGDRRLRVQLAAVSSQLGQMELRGTANLETGEFLLSAVLPQVRLGRPLLDRLAEYAPELREPELRIAGSAAIRGEIAHHPASATPWSVSARAEVINLSVQHPDLPLPLEQGEVALRLEGQRLYLEKLDGRAHGARVQARGELHALSADADFEFGLTIQHVHVEPNLYPRLSAPLRRLCANFSPEGSLSVETSFQRRGGRLSSRHLVRLHNMRMAYDDFPYPVEKIEGTLDYVDSPGGELRLAVNLNGTASGQPVQLSGEVTGEGLRPGNDYRTGLSLDIAAQNVPIDETLFAALKPQSLRIARQFRPSGLVDVAVRVRRPAGNAARPKPSPETVISAYVHHASIRYEKFPYDVAEVSGRLEIQLPSEQWRADGFVGRRKGAVFQCNAGGILDEQGERVTVFVSGVNALLDEELRQALPLRMQRVWDRLQPGGRADFLVRVDVLGKQEPEFDLALTARGCRIKPTFFPYEITDLLGRLRYVKDRVTLGEMSGRHGANRIFLGRDGYGGSVALRARGGFRAELLHLRGEPLMVDAELLAALPDKLQRVLRELRPDQPLRVALDLTVDREEDNAADVYAWDGQATFADCTFHAGVEIAQATGVAALQGSYDGRRLHAEGNLHLRRASVFRLPLEEVTAGLRLADNVLVLPGVQARLYGGTVYGPIRAELGEMTQYRLDLTASNIDLEAFARQTLGRSGAVNGRAFGRVLLIGAGNDLGNLRGAGSLDISSGKLYDLPVIVNLLTIVGGSLPKGTAFQEAYVRFTVEEGRLHFSRFDLLGDALSLKGQGSMSVNGKDLDLRMYGMLWGRAMPLLPPVVNRIPPAISRNLMSVHVTGSMDDPKVDREPVPVVTEALRQLMEGRSGRRSDSASPKQDR